MTCFSSTMTYVLLVSYEAIMDSEEKHGTKMLNVNDESGKKDRYETID